MKFNRERLAGEWRQLKQVDLQSLDFNEAGSWPVLLKVIICSIVLALAFAAMCWFVVREHSTALEEARAQEYMLLDEFEKKAIQAAYLPRVRRRLELLDEQMRQVRQMLPTSVEISSLLDSINDAAVDNRLKIDHIRSLPEVDKEFYVEHPFSIQVQGDYHEIAGFVAEMAALSRIVTQHDFTLKPLGEQQGERLSLSMQARTYSYQNPADTQKEQP